MFYKRIVILENTADIDNIDGSRQFFNYSFSKAIRVFREECPGVDGMVIGHTGEAWVYLGRVADIVV